MTKKITERLWDRNDLEKNPHFSVAARRKDIDMVVGRSHRGSRKWFVEREGSGERLIARGFDNPDDAMAAGEVKWPEGYTRFSVIVPDDIKAADVEALVRFLHNAGPEPLSVPFGDKRRLTGFPDHVARDAKGVATRAGFVLDFGIG